MENETWDVVIVGAGFAGIYQLYRLLGAGLKVKLIEQGKGPGGTWYWNRYPGAMSDTESFVYRFSWDSDDLREYPWQRQYLQQKDVLAYLEHVVDRHDLRKHMRFDTELLGADYDEAEKVWKVETSTGALTTRFLITALGLLSKQNWPDIPGMATYKGELYHTARFPEEYDLRNKRVGVIGCGSTGIQLITTIASQVKTLTCFQRRPQYSVPAGDKPVTAEDRESVNRNYDQIWHQVKNSFVGMGFEESKTPAMSVSAEERQRVYQEAWDKGNGLRFMFGTFSDISTDEQANETACAFIREKIAQMVKDPVKAKKLTPTEPYARRPLCDTGYYQQFNRDNVDIVDLKETPIESFTETGIKLVDGTVHELDVVICATGFDAGDGNYNRLRIRGRNQQSLKEHWQQEPTSYLGASVPNFPNFFMITGPKSVFSNIPPAVEACVDFITGMIQRAEEHSHGAANGTVNGAINGTVNGDAGKHAVEIEATSEAERDWVDLCNVLSATSLFTKTDSWIFGSNVAGKKRSVLFFFGGLGLFRQKLQEVVDAGYKGYKPF